MPSKRSHPGHLGWPGRNQLSYELGTITLTEDTIEKCQYATVISVGSEYFLRTIESEVKDNTIYITAFKTTLLNNKALDYQKQIYSFELQEINRIVFVNRNGAETVLWSREAASK